MAARPIGVLVANLGTPDAPTAPALRRYLREFLSDRRVIELSRWKWWLVLNLFILPFRPKRSAKLYRKIWKSDGSPLLVVSKQQAERIEAALREKLPGCRVALGMRYGNPSIAQALGHLEDQGCRRVIVSPMYPQYSASTTASTYDAVFDALRRRRWVPELRTIGGYHDDPAYVRALAASIRETWERAGEPERLMFSFHGIPRRYHEAGDPYRGQCEETARLVAGELGLEEDRWITAFQSRFGKEPWLEPYTDETLRAWGEKKLESVDVVCPGFSADCLETLDEIGRENREQFERAGGGRYRYINALNTRTDHIRCLADVILRHVGGW